MLLRVSVGVAACSRTPAPPITATWTGVAGDEEASNVGSSPALALSNAAKARTAVTRRYFAKGRCMDEILWMTISQSHVTIAFRFPGLSLTSNRSTLTRDDLQLMAS